ncbi:MAG: (d)CMP kinase [Oscillospiraceae bacterium]|nr:(d)CMP kinase [Oscillospiraceae bacterium]
MNSTCCSVAIDGPAGAGKSTIAKAAAARFGFIYVDTGAIYRTVGLAVRRAGIDREDGQAVASLLPELSIRLDYGPDGTQRMYLNGEDVSAAIRQPEISMYASAVSAIPAVRAFLLDMQRDMAKNSSVVMDGRDIGTVVLPDAGLKIFLTASAEARAKRRLAELQQKGESCTLQQVMDDMLLRDAQDANRATAPLRAAEDAILADTTDFTLEESIEYVCRLIRERFGPEER